MRRASSIVTLVLLAGAASALLTRCHSCGPAYWNAPWTTMYQPRTDGWGAPAGALQGPPPNYRVDADGRLIDEDGRAIEPTSTDPFDPAYGPIDPATTALVTAAGTVIPYPYPYGGFRSPAWGNSWTARTPWTGGRTATSSGSSTGSRGVSISPSRTGSSWSSSPRSSSSGGSKSSGTSSAGGSKSSGSSSGVSRGGFGGSGHSSSSGG